jgi:hypothetical protein
MPFDHQHETDVAVFGAGPAGIAAAVSAAREGQRVSLFEVQDRIGGVMASCPGMMLGAGYPCGRTIGGFFQELVDRLTRQDPPAAERRPCSLKNFGDEVVYDPETAITVLMEMMQEVGVRVCINHIPQRVKVERDCIHWVEVAHIQGCDRVNAKIYLDCTGNGDVAHRAGVPSCLGDGKGQMMGATLTFIMDNVDWDRAFPADADPYFTACAERGIRDGRIHETIPQIYALKGLRLGSVFFNTVTVTGVDGRSILSVLAGTMTARRRVLDLARFCKETLPGFEHAHLTQIGPIVGVRETRRLEGMYELTYEDIARATHFEDGIVACDNPLDEVFRDEYVKFYSHEPALPKGAYYTIPFRALVPRELCNLLFAGRNMSVELKAFASIRGMPQCMAMGQAVGMGAAVAIRNACRVQDLPSWQVVDGLASLGVKGIGGQSL